jgi:Fe-Mn family superoxide dismutase
MPFSLPPLPYAKNALAPHISAETLEFHYGKHHQAYVDNLNKLVGGTSLENQSLEDLVRKTTSGPVFNNAAQVWNHTFYWNSLSPQGGGEPKGPLADALTKKFGSFAAFKEIFTKNALGHFGSGWVWLIKTPDGGVDIETMPNAGTPLVEGKNGPPHLRRVGTRLLHRLPECPRQIRGRFLEPRSLGLRVNEF